MRNLIVLVACLLFAGCQSEIDCGSTSVTNVVRKIATEHPDNTLVRNILSASPSSAAKQLQDERTDKMKTMQSAINDERRKLAEASARDSNSIQECLRAYGRNSAATQELYSNIITVDTFSNACQTPSDRKFLEANPPSVQAIQLMNEHRYFASQRTLATQRDPVRYLNQVNEILRLISAMRTPVEAEYESQKDKTNRAIAEISKEIPRVGEQYDNRIAALRSDAKMNAVYDVNTIRTETRDPQTEKLICRADLGANIPEWGSAHSTISYSVQKTSEGGIYVQILGL